MFKYRNLFASSYKIYKLNEYIFFVRYIQYIAAVTFTYWNIKTNIIYTCAIVLPFSRFVCKIVMYKFYIV